MAGSLNLCQFIGNLGRDPDVRSLQDGSKVCNLSLACTDSWRDKNTGERKERTEWVRVVIFNDKLAEVAEKYCRKGSKIYVAGAMQTRKWTDQNGQDRYSTEVVLQRFNGSLTLLDGKREEDSGAYSSDDETPPWD